MADIRKPETQQLADQQLVGGSLSPLIFDRGLRFQNYRGNVNSFCCRCEGIFDREIPPSDLRGNLLGVVFVCYSVKVRVSLTAHHEESSIDFVSCLKLYLL